MSEAIDQRRAKDVRQILAMHCAHPLRIIAVLCLVVEHGEKTFWAGFAFRCIAQHGQQVGSVNQRCDVLCIGQCGHCRISCYDGVLIRPLPVSVLGCL